MQLKETAKRKRLANFIIDIISIGILIEITFQIEATTPYPSILKIIRMFILLGGYHILMEYFLGKTVGKYITKCHVVNRDGSKITFRTAVIRFICRFIPFEFLSLALGYDAKAWHDLISKTLVIDDTSV